jgi:hypothetical protein
MRPGCASTRLRSGPATRLPGRAGACIQRGGLSRPRPRRPRLHSAHRPREPQSLGGPELSCFPAGWRCASSSVVSCQTFPEQVYPGLQCANRANRGIFDTFLPPTASCAWCGPSRLLDSQSTRSPLRRRPDGRCRPANRIALLGAPFEDGAAGQEWPSAGLQPARNRSLFRQRTLQEDHHDLELGHPAVGEPPPSTTTALGGGAAASPHAGDGGDAWNAGRTFLTSGPPSA